MIAANTEVCRAQGQPSGRKRVRWPDEVDAQDFGFSIDGASRQQVPAQLTWACCVLTALHPLP